MTKKKAPDVGRWRQNTLALRDAAKRHELARDALLTLAEDCEQIADQLERGPSSED